MTHDPPRRERGRTRAISTVLDVALFLLLVSAAIGLVYAAPRAGGPAAGGTPDVDPDVAAEATTTLATTTTTVRYAPAGAGEDAPQQPARGTVAEHLAAATVANAALEDRPLHQAPRYEAAVRNATRATRSRIQAGTAVQVRTRWEPLPGSDLRGELVVGPSPPPDADVHAATLAVPVASARETGIGAPAWTEAAGGWPGNTTASGRAGDDSGGDAGTADDSRTGADVPAASLAGESVAAPTNRTLVEVAERRGCAGVATAVARRVVGARFPPERTGVALRARGGPRVGGDLRERTVARYRTAAVAAGLEPGDVPVDVEGSDGDAARATNAALVRGLADDLEPTACSYGTATAAAEAAEPDAVTVVVRTWSR